MKAVTCTNGKLELTELPTPEPERGQLLIDVLRCGICGSDLHARLHCDEAADVASEVGYEGLMRSHDEIVLGHEYCGEVVDAGPRTGRSIRTGTRVVAMPLLRRGKDVHPVGLSIHAPGGYAQQMVVQESLTLPVPNGLPTDIAALTEPMAVGLHAVRRSEIGKGETAIVIGCGPVGLAVICMLKARGVRTIIASDFSAGRRGLAHSCGADIVVDPGVDSPFETTERHRHLTSATEVFDLAVTAMDKLRRLPLPWWRVWQAAELVGLAKPKHPVIFECVGVPGVIEQIITSAPLYSRVVVVGVCMQSDRFRPSMAINKEIDLRFVLGYTPPEFRESLHLLAEGKVAAAPIVTGVVGLPGVENAFTALGDADRHAKILINPKSTSSEPELEAACQDSSAARQ